MKQSLFFCKISKYVYFIVLHSPVMIASNIDGIDICCVEVRNKVISDRIVKVKHSVRTRVLDRRQKLSVVLKIWLRADDHAGAFWLRRFWAIDGSICACWDAGEGTPQFGVARFPDCARFSVYSIHNSPLSVLNEKLINFIWLAVFLCWVIITSKQFCPLAFMNNTQTNRSKDNLMFLKCVKEMKYFENIQLFSLA